jgi:hypothetical protein
MKFSMLVPCGKCGNQMTVEATGEECYPDAQCNVCGTATWVTDDGRISRRAFCRAEVELVREDWSVAIILGAMSVECELAYLYSKWKSIEANLLPNEVTLSQTDLWEKEFRELNNIGRRIDAVSNMLTGVTFDAFMGGEPQVASAIHSDFPQLSSRSPKEFFVEELFWKRNKILHSGKVQFGRVEAELSVRVAVTLLQALDAMNRQKYNVHFRTP